MKKTLVVSYSDKGSNRYLAGLISKQLGAPSEEIKPFVHSQFLLMMGLGLGIRKMKQPVKEFDRIILVGPVWMGKFVYPLKKFTLRHRRDIRELVFVTCCGSGFDIKDEKFGHGTVFGKVKELLPDTPLQCKAFPIPELLTEEERKDPKRVMETRLSDDTFQGELREQFKEFMAGLES
ncbi:MAG: hypothetical protein R2751_02920 [Bacteroidales bacterium]